MSSRDISLNGDSNKLPFGVDDEREDEASANSNTRLDGVIVTDGLVDGPGEDLTFGRVFLSQKGSTSK